MRGFVILGGMEVWFIWGLVWIYPIKRKLQKLHGFDKDNNYYIELSKNNDPMAFKAYKRTKIYLFVGIIFGTLIVLSA